MTIWERVRAALLALAVPMAASDYIVATGSALPDLYLVYFQVSGVGEQHADDVEISRSKRVQISIYSRAGLISLPDITSAMVAAGFTPGPDREIPYNSLTRHYGWAKDFFFLEAN
jgi:hypothetical protein